MAHRQQGWGRCLAGEGSDGGVGCWRESSSPKIAMVLIIYAICCTVVPISVRRCHWDSDHVGENTVKLNRNVLRTPFCEVCKIIIYLKNLKVIAVGPRLWWGYWKPFLLLEHFLCQRVWRIWGQKTRYRAATTRANQVRILISGVMINKKIICINTYY